MTAYSGGFVKSYYRLTYKQNKLYKNLFPVFLLILVRTYWIEINYISKASCRIQLYKVSESSFAFLQKILPGVSKFKKFT